MNTLSHVAIFTDGACLGNPGPGGYAAILVSGTHRRELSGAYTHTTNNRMELLAAIHALEALKRPCQVTVTSDSRYLVDGVERGLTSRAVANRDLWRRLLALCAGHTIAFVWVRGHSGHVENERCDELATLAIHTAERQADAGYEAAQQSQPSLFDTLVGVGESTGD